MGQAEKMLRVSKSRPCPVCGKPDWCLRAEDDSSAICARIEDGSTKRCGQAGWLHVLSAKPFTRKRHLMFRTEIPKSAYLNTCFSMLCQQYRDNLSPVRLNMMAKQLYVTPESLLRLGMGWDERAYTFAMSDAKGHIIGIRRRFIDGSKCCVAGSQIGLFIPTGLSGEEILICEGPTDTAAALSLGFDAVGRPNCNSGNDILIRFVKAKPVVIVSDNDEAGKVGAEGLARQLRLYCPSVKIICPPNPHKDLRNWLKAGLTAGMLRERIEKSPLMKAVISHG
jgi:hypothetical protein